MPRKTKTLKTKEVSPTSPRPEQKQKVLIITVVSLIGLLLYFKGLFVAAVVNNQPISRVKVLSELEKKGGSQTLDSIISRTLIFQEAQRRGINISQSELDKEYEKLENSIKSRGQNIEAILKEQGLSKKEVMEEIKIQKIVEKIYGKDIKVTDKEIDKFIEENKALVPEGTDPKELRKNVEAQLKQQKLNEKTKQLVEELKKKANVVYFVNY